MAVVKHSAATRKVLRALENELEASAVRVGQKLSWTAAEQAILDLICAEIDRKTDLSAAYEVCRDDPKVRVKLSAELRLIEASIARLLKSISTEPPASRSLRSEKAARAVRVRWDRSRDGAV